MNSSMRKFEEQQKILREQFAERARADAARLDELVAELPNANRLQSLEEMRHLAHRLSGGAGIFGFGEITEPAGILESSIDVDASDAEILNNTKSLTQIIRDTVQIKATQ